MPGPVSQAIRVVAVDVGDVGDATDINHDDRPLALQRLGERAMVDRNKRCTLAAGGDVGGTEIVHHWNMDGLGQRARIADLDRQLPLGPVQHGLAMKADDIDFLAGNAVLRREGRHGFGMREGDGALGFAQDTGPRVALRQTDRLGQGLTQQPAFPVGVGPVPRGAKGPYPFAVGFDQCDIDPVERGAAHQTDCRHHHRQSAFATSCLTPSLCHTGTSYNATARRAAAAFLLWFRNSLQIM